ncbi:MAG TPA: c-type cytochrome [Ignavibacteria bacterium]|nr:c-type cytochrome [Ignavibacteria bacterium]HRJ98627.1 c-type cytochrome [Ignavibacteria bacterium]
MKKFYLSLLSFTAVFVFFSFNNSVQLNQNGLPIDSLEAEKENFVNIVKETIKGKEGVSSDSVFRDIQMLKGVPAENLLNIMNYGFSKALGVGCDHCHNTTDWASNEKNAKQISREMMKMSGQIRDMISNIKEIESEKATINCTTCHRGEIVPALKMKD